MPNPDGSPTINEIINMAGSISALKRADIQNQKDMQAIDLQKQTDTALGMLNKGVNINAPVVSNGDYAVLTQGMSPEDIKNSSLKKQYDAGQTPAQALNLNISPTAAMKANELHTANIENQQKQKSLS